MDTGVYSISYGAWHRMAAAFVKNCGKELASSRTAMPTAGLRIVSILALIDMLKWIRRIHPNDREHEVGTMEVIV